MGIINCKIKAFFSVLFIILLLLPTHSILARVSENYCITIDVVDAGGGYNELESYNLFGSIGQSIINVPQSQSENYNHDAGFLYGINASSCYILGQGSWPMFRHDPNHTGYTVSPAPDTDSDAWGPNTSGTSYDESSPSVINGKLYIGHLNNLECWNAVNGEFIWAYRAGSMSHSCPALANGKVYVGSDDGYVYCLPQDDPNNDGIIEDTEVIWKYDTGNSVLSSPTVADGKIYIGSHNDYVYCLPQDDPNGDGIIDEETEVIWKYKTKGNVLSSPAVADGKVYVGSNPGNVYCLPQDDPNGDGIIDEDTEVIWKFSMEKRRQVFSSPAIANGKVYIGSEDDIVYCLPQDDPNGDGIIEDTEDYSEVIWRYKTGDGVKSSPALANGKVYVGSDDGYVYCLPQDDPNNDGIIEDTEVIWKYRTGEPEENSPVKSSPAVVDDKVYVGAKDYFYCLPQDDPNGDGIIENTEVIWDRFTGKIYMGSSPAVADGRVYVAGGSDLYAFGTPIACDITISPESKEVSPGDAIRFCADESGNCKTSCYEWSVTGGSGARIDVFDDNCAEYTAGNIEGIDTIVVTDPCNGNIEASATVTVSSNPKSPYYGIDFLENGNNGGWESSLKTFDDSFTVSEGSIFYVDVWIRNTSSLPDPTNGGCWLNFTGSTALLSVTDVQRYNNQEGELSGPWSSGGLTVIGPSGEVNDGQVLIQVVNLGGAARDGDGEVIIARVEFECLGLGDVNVSVSTIPGFGTWAPTPPWLDTEVQDKNFMVSQIPECDADGVPDNEDNCRCVPNGPDLGTCTSGTLGGNNMIGKTCLSTAECGDEGFCSMGQEDTDADEYGDVCDNCPDTSNLNQEDTYPPQGNGIGDACDCEVDFNCDQSVDAFDTTAFLIDFGRGIYVKPCESTNPCSGDVDCDGDVDTFDMVIFLDDFGRGFYINQCPTCKVGDWCSY